MIASRLFEHYLSAPTPPPPPPPHPPSVFLWLSAVRVHTHPWAKESKIDHTSNWSRCTGTGSSSRADLSHAGKIMHPELTAQHTRLPSTSFLKRSRNFPIGRKKREKKTTHEGKCGDSARTRPQMASRTRYGSSSGGRASCVHTRVGLT